MPNPIHALVFRIITEYDKHLVFEKNALDDDKDVFELKSSGHKIRILGNNYNYYRLQTIYKLNL